MDVRAAGRATKRNSSEVPSQEHPSSPRKLMIHSSERMLGCGLR